MALGFVVMLFLPEIPLRRSHRTAPLVDALTDEVVEFDQAMVPNELLEPVPTPIGAADTETERELARATRRHVT